MTSLSEFPDQICALWDCRRRIPVTESYCLNQGHAHQATVDTESGIPCHVSRIYTYSHLQKVFLPKILDCYMRDPPRLPGIPDLTNNWLILSTDPREQPITFDIDLSPREDHRIWLFLASFAPHPDIWIAGHESLFGNYVRRVFRLAIPVLDRSRWILHRYTLNNNPFSAFYTLQYFKPPVLHPLQAQQMHYKHGSDSHGMDYGDDKVDVKRKRHDLIGQNGSRQKRLRQKLSQKLETQLKSWEKASVESCSVRVTGSSSKAPTFVNEDGMKQLGPPHVCYSFVSYLAGTIESSSSNKELTVCWFSWFRDLGFLDCLNIDEEALKIVVSVWYLSVAGTSNIKWSSQSLKVLCAVNCHVLEEDTSFINSKLLALFTNIFDGLASLFVGNTKKPKDVFAYWRELMKKTKDKAVDEIMLWIEQYISHTLLRTAECNPEGLDEFWLNQGAALLLTLMQSSQEDVQERSATGLATFVVIDDENASIDCGRAEAVMKDGGIRLLLELAKSWREGLQSEAAKAIANLSVNASVAKSVAEEGGIRILVGLAKSMNRLVAEEAAGGLWNLSVGEEHKNAIAQAGGVKALVDLIFRWPNGCDGVLERAAGALANLAADDKCSMEVATAGGVHALVMLARNCKYEGVQEQAARALANLAAHGDSNNNNAAVGQEAGALEALVQLTQSPHEGVRQEAAGALWNLSFDDKNRESIAAAGGVEALVALAQSCSNASTCLQERAAGALWGLSVSEANSVAIGREGGIPPLIALARSEAEDVHETAAGALWNLAFNPGNALRIVEEGGVPALVHLCLSSVSKMARFMAALALSYMFDGRMAEYAMMIGTSSSESTSKTISLDGARTMALKHIEAFVKTFMDPQIFAAAAVLSYPTLLAQVTERARIQEAGHLRCSGAEIGRFVTMLRNHNSTLKACAAFALLQFTIPGGRHAMHHASLMQNVGEARFLRSAAASAKTPSEAKIFVKIILRNLEHHQAESSI